MSRKVFINLPVADLPAAKAFYVQLGFEINEQFTDDKGSCVVISEHIHVMLLTHEFFSGFTPRPLSNAHQATEVLVALSMDSREAVDEIVRRAQDAGGQANGEPQDHGFMYAHSFMDLDGHIWEPLFLDEAAMA
ncbi:VOC family protein [Halomonas huangheensis]|uniref:VOC domain-containing protein n=1 Tax=Halomonas huangheensis TaxID=1178482 RepID=W1N8U2_9GAMM|nr:VOC family protein [Halomonas huangheensis]ALM53244.1 extradiol dioxygenase [Halomonas huangheensis]ERL51626.1 hypothetical protein BJB45_13300 [Halomonas huangheensis]